MNEVIESPKVTPKGLIKVELFDDATGKKVEEVNTHNFISRGVLRSLFNAKVNDIFTLGRAKNGHNVSSIFNDPFAQISLTTADHPELPETEWLRAGALVGYAYSDATYSGVDILRGSYNAAESFTKQGHVHMVFDFPTNAANGEIKSIYFHPKEYAFTSTADSTLLTGLRSIQKHDEQYYMLKEGKLEVYNLSLELLNTFTIPSGTNIRDFCIKDDEIYFVRDSSNDAVVKAPVSNPSAVVRVVNLPFYNAGGIAFDITKQHFVIAEYSGSTQTMYYYDINFSDLKKEVIGATGSDYSNGVITYDRDFMITGRVFLEKENNFTKISSRNICGIIDNTIYFDGHKRPKSFIGSRCLLDTPITKEPTQTMKITYDFVLPSIY